MGSLGWDGTEFYFRERPFPDLPLNMVLGVEVLDHREHPELRLPLQVLLDPRCDDVIVLPVLLKPDLVGTGLRLEPSALHVGEGNGHRRLNLDV